MFLLLQWDQIHLHIHLMYDFENWSTANTQSWKMSNLLHGPISTNQILPQEKRVNRDICGTSNQQNMTYGVSCDE